MEKKNSNTELPKALILHEDPTAVRPTSYLIGKTEEGAFRTASAKEYPIHLNRAFAASVASSLRRWTLANGDDAAAGPGATEVIEIFGQKLADIAARAEHGELFPDYQPRS